MPGIPCFRDGAAPPPLETLEERLKRPARIRCRKWDQEKSERLSVLLSNEKAIERSLRSKSGWDAIFELCPMAPWRETAALEVASGTILYLDYKNFYPALLCSIPFPHPAHLTLVKNPQASQTACGLFRVRLHPTVCTPEAVKRHHPFTMSHQRKSLPFLIGNRPIDTLLHGTELPIWQKWFDLEIPEGLVSNPVDHPLKLRTLRALIALEEIPDGDPAREEHKLIINYASTTPKINTPSRLPSPFGVHCLPAQISAMARALLCETAHMAINAYPGNRLLQANTDGILLETQNPEKTLEELKIIGVLGNHPGQLRFKAMGDEALIAGTNLWWLLQDGQMITACGRGGSTDTVPLFHHYGPDNRHRIASVHLADFRHQLDHQTRLRTKFEAPESPEGIHQKIDEEKTKSLRTTAASIRKLRKRLANQPTANTGR